MMHRAVWKGAGLVALALGVVVAAACGVASNAGGDAEAKAKRDAVPADAATATFAGGCFWCMEPPFEKLDGVYSVVSGYTAGPEKNPTYEEVAGGQTGHTEAIRIRFDPERVSYELLLDVFWREHDPTDARGQFVDRGSQYRPGIYWHDDEQRRLAEASRDALQASGRFDEPIATEIEKAGPFYEAEPYHQDFYKKSERRYQRYRYGSGRDQFLDAVWGDERHVRQGAKQGDRADLRSRLTPLQYHVTQEDGTEPPFRNEFWDNKRAGIYVDVVSGEPLFSSTDKYASGTGWPSFTRPLVAENIVEREDHKMLAVRTEVRSAGGDSHLGHVFPDGPEPTGLRYCINSAALRFIPRDELEREGYEEYVSLFDE